jgi:hypothetical protein
MTLDVWSNSFREDARTRAMAIAESLVRVK